MADSGRILLYEDVIQNVATSFFAGSAGVTRMAVRMSTALLPVTLSMLCAGMAGIFLVLGVLVLGVYALNKFFSGK